MRIMITGSNGVIGREIVDFLVKNINNKLILLVNKRTKRRNKIKLFYHDLTRPINFNTKIDAIIHCASKNPASDISDNPKKIYSMNIKMTKNLINFSNKKKVRKIIFFSAMDVYGTIKSKVLFENQKSINSNLYGKSKFVSEKLFCAKKNTFKAVCIRIPGILTLDLSRNRPLIIRIIKKIINNKDIHAYNLDKKFNNILDTYEIIRFINIVLKKNFSKSNIYNFSASRPIKFIHVIGLIKKIFNSKSKIIKNNLNKNSFIISNKKIQNDFNVKISTTKKIITRCCQNILAKKIEFRTHY